MNMSTVVAAAESQDWSGLDYLFVIAIVSVVVFGGFWALSKMFKK